MKAISPLISVIILIGIVVAIGSMLSPWVTRLVLTAMYGASNDTQTRELCRNTAYDFDTSYGNLGLEWDFGSDMLRAKIENTGTINLHGFSFELETETAGGMNIYDFLPRDTSQRTKTNPLKPGQDVILEANITESVSGTLREVKILNEACTSVYITQGF